MQNSCGQLKWLQAGNYVIILTGQAVIGVQFIYVLLFNPTRVQEKDLVPS